VKANKKDLPSKAGRYPMQIECPSIKMINYAKYDKKQELDDKQGGGDFVPYFFIYNIKDDEKHK
jgi:hypothetical protein